MLKMHCIKDNTTPMNPDILTDWICNFVKRSKLPHFTPNSLRHTHTTLFIAKGVSIPTVSRCLGHSSITTTIPVPNSNTIPVAVHTDINKRAIPHVVSLFIINNDYIL